MKNIDQQREDNCTAALIAVATFTVKIRNLKDEPTPGALRKATEEARKALTLWENMNGLEYLNERENAADYKLCVRVWIPLRSVVHFLEKGRADVAKMHGRDLHDDVNRYADGICYGIDPFPKDIAKVIQFLTR
jgi:hypothetical protein